MFYGLHTEKTAILGLYTELVASCTDSVVIKSDFVALSTDKVVVNTDFVAFKAVSH